MTTRIYQIKKIDPIVMAWYQKQFPDCTYSFYWYKAKGEKIIGCAVFKGGILHHTATQATLKEYMEVE